MCSFQTWFSEKNNSGELPKLLFPEDSTSAMQIQISSQIEQLTTRTRELNIASATTQRGLTSFSNRGIFQGLGRGQKARALPWNPEKK